MTAGGSRSGESPAARESEQLTVFLEQRPRLVRLAYRYLGSIADAEDMVQEAWLRFVRVDGIRDAAPLLSTIVTRLCLDRMKSAQVRRELYVGPWLPEPVVECGDDVAEDRALDISFAVMRALERLSPAERAAYFLHDLWGLTFEEIAAALSRSPAACRKLASRARQGLTEARPRYQPDAAEVERFVAVFRHAVAEGDPAPLQALLADDAELISDGGGKVRAALRVIRGADAVGRFLLGVTRKNAHRGAVLMVPARVNDAPGLLQYRGGVLEQTFSFDLDERRHVRTLYIVRNPDKLARIPDSPAAVES